MRVFVTGGNGFIGSVVVRSLIGAGHDVVCLLRPTSRTDRIDDLAFERVRGDILDIASFRDAMSACEHTLHLAAPGGWTNDEPRALMQVIEGGTANVLAVAGRCRGHRVVVVSSTAAINASDRAEIFDERAGFTVGDPSLVYAHAKHRAELLVRAACERGTDVVIVNPGEVYGPHDVALGTASNLLDFATSRPVLVCRGGTSIVHVDDVSSGIIAALERGRTGERYILGGENLTIQQLASLVLDLVGRRARLLMVPTGFARWGSHIAARLRLPLPFNPQVVPYATRYWFVDNTKARQELGVTFRNARTTISSTVDWLKAAGLFTMPAHRS